MEGTEALRRAAPDWSLAGDQQLLAALQDLHQRIILRCTETNTKLDEMMTSLDDAGVSLQNVNNKFTALSNSQFIESRVYDDDVELVNEAEKPVEQPQPISTGPDLESIRRSLQVLESMHESVTILCDSDSDSEDEENVARVVLKPKDLYADRPLPHIIGSQAWKNKWHAGLLRDESDSEEDDTKPVPRDSEQYSESESECSELGQEYPSHSTALQGAQRDIRTISSSSSDTSPPPAPQLTPADVAAELARRLGASKMPPQPVEYSPPEPTVRKVYKPEKPTPGNIFSDEPPPLEMDQSEESDDDIFAQINKNQPYNKTNKDQNSIAEDLFGTPIFEDVEQKIPPPKQKSTLSDGESEPELFATKPQVVKHDDTGTKKPVGGMSLFGTNKNAESIGAAILKRNQRHSSNSGDESDEPRPQIKHNKPQIKNNDVTEQTRITKQVTETENNNNVERDIFDDLFARSEKINKAKETEKIKDKKDTKKSVDFLAKGKEPQKKVDVFADNLFDDIDDIFTTDVKVVKANDSEKAKPKSIFDDDDDDLFSDIAVTNKSKENRQNTVIKAKSILDSDEELFAEKSDERKANNEPKNQTKQTPPKPNKTEFSNERVSTIVKESKGLFDDSDDELFSNTKAAKVNKNNANADERRNTKINTDTAKSFNENQDDFFAEKGDDLFKSKIETTQAKSEQFLKPKLDINKAESDLGKATKPNVMNSTNLFDDDDDDEADLFKTTPSSVKTKDDEVTPAMKQDDRDSLNNYNPDLKSNNNVADNNINTTKEKEATTVSSKEKKQSIFDEKVEEDLFSKRKTEIESPKQKILDNTLPQKSPNVFDEDKFEDNENSTKIDQTSKALNATVIAKPDISRKPVIAPKNERIAGEILKTTKIDTLDNAVIETVPDNKQVVDSNRNVTNTNFKRDDQQKDLDQGTTVKSTASDFEDSENTHSIQSSYSNIDEPKLEAKDIFSDIFNDQPPIFEKPKEPKKSKNINALFDDDSDDEALFLRKTEVVDENPASFPNTNDDRLFGIFRDEPPDIDVDELFADKNTDQKPSKIKPETNYGDENLIKSVSSSNESQDFDIDFVKQPIKKTNHDFVDNKVKKDLFSDVTEDIFKKPTSLIFDDEDESARKTDVSVKDIDSHQKDISQTDMFDSELEKTDGAQIESKKIGKLKPMNLNINVNSLLPGASPKKVAKSVEETDGQVLTKSNEELPVEETSEDSDPKLVKSVSFEGKPDSPILDNKLSKERAKIQVKRRPSTRRARREAVKKSGIDFGEDNTDDASTEQATTEDCKNATITDASNEIIRTLQNEKEATKDIENDTQSNVKEIISTTANLGENKIVTKETEVSNTEKNVKSKVVYILNDEDIFNVPSHPEIKAPPKKLEIFDDLEVTNKENELNTEAVTESQISTLGQVYKTPKDFTKDINDENLFKEPSRTIKTTNTDLAQTDSDEDLFKPKTSIKNKKADNNLQESKNTNVKNENNDIFFKSEPKTQVSKPSKSLFDDLDDEELFSANKKTIKSTDKVKIFDSDSDEDLFGNKSKKREVRSLEKEVKEVKRIEVKGSLFGDEDDDDDLFGAKTKKSNELQQSSKAKVTSSAKEVHSKTTEPVAVDPLSLFGDGED